MDFDTPINRRGTDSVKWDLMEKYYGVSPDEGLSMWVADMDFQVPQCVRDRLAKMVDHGIFAYFNNDADYLGAIQWWMQNRHRWKIEQDWIFTTTGLVNAVGMCLDTFTQPGDGIVLFTPVYHAFAKVIRNAGRTVVECPMSLQDGSYQMEFDAWDAQLTGSESMLILCSPHNPGGRVWTREELQGVADFAKRHDLLIISDEIHHDLIYPGHTHVPFACVDPSAADRTIMLSAPSKTFNLAGLHTGNVIIEDADLRRRFAERMSAINLSSNSAGVVAATAAYSPDGAAWVDALMLYLQGNRDLFDAAIANIPGLWSMPLQSTFLSWVDFSGTGMEQAEFIRRVEKVAKIAVNHGTTFGTGGESFLRFNIGTQRANVAEACDRLRSAFSDLQ